MSSTQQIASFRTVSAGILASAHLAAQDERPEVTKKDISLILKRAAPALGIDGTTYHVLDILLGLVQPDDFKPERRPVVAISNFKLAEYTRRTSRTVTRCLKKLVEAGILAYRDSPTGRRFVYRGSDGAPEQAYGLDFTPACFNLRFFKEQADAFQRRIKAEQEAKRAATRFSRALADMALIDTVEFHRYVILAQEVLDRKDINASDKAEMLQALYLEAIAVYERREVALHTQMSCAGDIDVSLLLNTSHPDQINSNKTRPGSNEQGIKSKLKKSPAVDNAYEIKPIGNHPKTQQAISQRGKSIVRQNPQPNLDGISIGLIQSACSTIQSDLRIKFSTWPGLCEATEQLRMLIGLSLAGFQFAVERQGKYLAAACLAVVAEKALRDPEQISSPGGYFRAMIDRAGEGKLYLHKSLHGLVWQSPVV